jgi:hypothetical protein
MPQPQGTLGAQRHVNSLIIHVHVSPARFSGDSEEVRNHRAFVHTNPHHHGCVPIWLLCKSYKRRGPRGFASSTVVVSIACPIYIIKSI